MDTADLTDLVTEHATATNTVGASVGLLRDGEAAFACHGSPSLDADAPVDEHTRFLIASVTKPLVATAIATLAETGRIHLDDPVARSVPEVRGSAWGETATIRHLLANTSGVSLRIEREFAFDGGDDVLSLLAASVATDRAATEPGTAWSYGNTGWSVLGRVIECATGSVWEDAMRDLVFAPLGMHATGFVADDGPRTTNYLLEADGPQAAGVWGARGCGPGGASVLSSASDLLAFAAAHLVEDRFAYLREEQAVLDFPWFLDAWCLGMARFDGASGSLFGWDGIGPGARAILRLAPAAGGAVVMLSNTSTGRALYRAVVPEIARRWLGVDLPEPPVTGKADDLSRYAGVFAWPDRTLTVDAEGDHLVVTDSAAPGPAVMRPLDERNFLGDPANADGDTLSFSRFDDAGVPAMAHRLVWGFPRVSD